MGNILNSLLAIDQHVTGQIGRKRKTPEELAAEARGESTEDDGK